MTDNLHQAFEVMKKELDALRAAISAKEKRWYADKSLLVSIVALLFSFGTTFVSYRRDAAQDIQATRQELRGLLQRLTAIPKEGVEDAKRYAADPAAAAALGSYLNQENTLLGLQAAELAKKLPGYAISGTEYYAVALALQNAYDLSGASEFFSHAIQASKDFNTEIAAIRMMANLQFIQGHPEAGRVWYQKALDIFSKYSGYDSYTQASTNIWTELAWANSEAPGSLSVANQHVDSAEKLGLSLTPSPGAESIKAQIFSQKQMYARIAQGVGTGLSQAQVPR